MTNKILTRISVMLIVAVVISLESIAQDDLMDLFDDGPTENITSATFKTTRVVNGHSVENVADGELLFLISHRFGKLNSGGYEMFGLDQSTIRLGFEYGIGERLNIGIGRSTMNKTVDGFVKYKILRQQSGKRTMPITLSYYGTVNVNGMRWQFPDRENLFSSRMAYVNQLLIARKFSSRLSIQLTPTHLHQNLVTFEEDNNDMFALGVGGRFKITNRITINAEYYYNLNTPANKDAVNALSLGVDIETGGHVFQLIFSNSRAMYDSAYVSNTTGSWGKGDIYFGFNISRMFTLK